MQAIAAIRDPQLAQKAEGKNKATARPVEVSFMETVSQAVRAGKIIVPTKAAAAGIDFEKNKMVNFDHIKWDEEEERINAFIGRIKRLLKDANSGS